MTYSTRAILALAISSLFAFPSIAQDVPIPRPNPTPPAVTCAQGSPVDGLIETAQALVEAGEVEELIVLKDDSMKRYVDILNARYNSDVPTDLSHLVIVVRKDSTAAIFGFHAGCSTGKAQLEPGVHAAIYGTEAGGPVSAPQGS